LLRIRSRQTTARQATSLKSFVRASLKDIDHTIIARVDEANTSLRSAATA